MPNFRNLSTKLYTLNPNQEGFSMVIWVFLVVFIFSVLVVTGSFSLDGTKSTYSAITSDTPTVSGAPKPSPPTTTKPSSLSHTFLGCDIADFPISEILAYNEKSGYVVIDVDNGSGDYKYYVDSEFTPPGKKYTAALLNSEGFSIRKWRIRLFEGGINTSGKWEGGIVKATDLGTPTGCEKP